MRGFPAAQCDLGENLCGAQNAVLSDLYLSSKHIFKTHTMLSLKISGISKRKTSARVVGTSGSQKSCMVCFYGTTSQGTFKLGQLQISICDDTWLKKKLALGSKQKEHWKWAEN